MAKDRNTVASEDQWDVATLYPDLQTWQAAVAAAIPDDSRWPALKSFQGRLGESPTTLKAALELFSSTSRELEKLYTYAHLRHDEDITHDAHKTAYNQVLSTLHDFSQETAWFEPELLALKDEALQLLVNDPILAEYAFHLEKIVRIKKHMLPPEGEKLMAMSGKALQTAHKAFSALNDADFSFGHVKDSQGNEHELTHGLYGLYMREQDRSLRENTFKTLHGKYQAFENTMSELLNGQVQAHVFNAKARHYTSSLEAALFPKNIDTAVYHALIKAVNDNLHVLHKYIALRERIMGVGQLHLYDMSVPLLSAVDMRMSYKEAEDIVIEAVAPLGSSYQDLLHKGLKEQRWVDRYENKNKRSGAYSSGCYDSHPYILMNFKGVLRDVFTLAHEAGHSMHSLYSHTHQPYHYSSYPIFLAEVASTFNEELLMRLLVQRAKTKEERMFLINEKIEDIRGTLFRQSMFAEFELLIHELAEKNVPLTPALLKQEYHKLNRRYFGERVIIDAEADAEWARIPHFYYNFYVFQYATGISAALALAERVLTEGAPARDAYLEFLRGGCSHYPIEMLQRAGVDMRSPKPVAAAMHTFGKLVDQLEHEFSS